MPLIGMRLLLTHPHGQRLREKPGTERGFRGASQEVETRSCGRAGWGATQFGPWHRDAVPLPSQRAQEMLRAAVATSLPVSPLSAVSEMPRDRGRLR